MTLHEAGALEPGVYLFRVYLFRTTAGEELLAAVGPLPGGGRWWTLLPREVEMRIGAVSWERVESAHLLCRDEDDAARILTLERLFGDRIQDDDALFEAYERGRRDALRGAGRGESP